MADEDDTEQETAWDHLFKIVLVGDNGVGKSNILSKFTKNEFSTDEKATIGVEFSTRVLTINGEKCKAQIWDTAGQERYRAITSAYYRGAAGAVLVYDVTDASSFASVTRWITELKQHASRDITCILLGNKIDLLGDKEREVAEEQARALCAELKMTDTLEVSAKTGTNIEEAFVRLCSKIHKPPAVVKNRKTSILSISGKNPIIQKSCCHT